MADPIVVEVTRGEVVEARHRVHAAVVDGTQLVLGAGDVDRVTYLRSSAKPLQVLPLVRARPELDDELVAIACSSHLARPEQLEAVRRLLAAAPASVDQLECGPEPTPLEHNCSGKHAGFLALCRARGWETEGYRLHGHPCQRETIGAVCEAAQVEPDTLPWSIDGCGVVTVALPLRDAAATFARLRTLEGGERVARAMRAYPALLRGPVAADAVLIGTLDGWVAKGGAEGLFCACAPDGLGVALKVEDGAFRAILPALGEVLRRLGIDPQGIDEVPVVTSRDDPVGVLRVSDA